MKEELYPCVHVEPGPLETNSETTFLMTETTTEISNSVPITEPVGYKPQISVFSFLNKEEVTEIDDNESGKADTSSGQLDKFLGELLSKVEVDPSDSPAELKLDTVPGLCWPEMPPVISLEGRTSESNMDPESALLLIQLDERSTDETHVDLSPNNEEIINSGYFPQATTLTSTT